MKIGLTKREDISGLIKREELTTRTFSVRLKTLNEKDRSVEAVIATEKPVLVMDWARWAVVEEVLLMSGVRMPASGQVPMLDTHDRSTVQKQLGSTRDIHVEDDKLIGRNYFSSSDVAEHSWTLTREGHLKDNSIGYRVINSVTIPKGEKAKVEGREFKASPTRDLRVTTEWELGENSVVPVGADKRAKNRNSLINQIGAKTMKDFRKWLEGKGLDYDQLDEDKRAELKAEFDAEQQRSSSADEPKKQPKKNKEPQRSEPKPAASDNEPDAVEIANRVLADERQRVSDIRALGGDDVPADTIERLISDGTSLADAQGVVLEAIRNHRPAVSPDIQVVSEMNRDSLVDAMLIRATHGDIVRAEKDGEQRLAAARRFSSMTLLDVCRMAIRLDGQEVPFDQESTLRAAFSTSSLPIILGNVAKKSMLKGYNNIIATWLKWCQVGSVSDFKTVTGARLTDTGALEKVGSGGEVKYGAAAEEYEQYSVATYAKNFGVTRQQIINDDMGAITRVPMGMGARARKKAGDLVYTHLLANGNMTDGIALFHASHSNLNTSAALTTSGKLAAGITAFAKQTDKDSQPINVEPRILLVPPDLKHAALELIKATTIVVAGSTDVNKPNYNALGDENLEVVSEVRLSNPSYTGYSATSWYLMGDKNLVDTIVVAFLNGKQEPTLEQFKQGPDVLGLVYRIYIDVGCKSMDFRGMQKNNA